MGKDKDKSSMWDDPYFTRRAETDALAEQYNINRDDYIETDIDGERGMTRDSTKDYEEAISNAAANHYDTRRSIELAKSQGYKGADKLSASMDSLGAIQEAQDFFNQVHDDQGNTGKFSSISDFHQMTDFLYGKDKEKFSADMESKWTEDIEEALAEGDAAIEENQQSQPIEYSDELKSAYKRQAEVNQSESADGGISNNIFANDDVADDEKNESFTQGEGFAQRKSAANSLLDKYKFDLSGGKAGVFM